MQISLHNQVAWITGGSEGIGRGIALLAAQSGARVAVTGRDVKPLESVAREICDQRGEVLVVPADVSDSQQVKQAVSTIIDRWGQLNFVCANAGTNGKWAPIDELTPEDWSATLQVNLGHLINSSLTRASGLPTAVDLPANIAGTDDDIFHANIVKVLQQPRPSADFRLGIVDYLTE